MFYGWWWKPEFWIGGGSNPGAFSFESGGMLSNPKILQNVPFGISDEFHHPSLGSATGGHSGIAFFFLHHGCFQARPLPQWDFSKACTHLGVLFGAMTPGLDLHVWHLTLKSWILAWAQSSSRWLVWSPKRLRSKPLVPIVHNTENPLAASWWSCVKPRELHTPDNSSRKVLTAD